MNILGNWYAISMTILTITSIILIIIASFQKQTSGNKPSSSCVLNSNSYITDISIAQNSVQNPNNFYCPSGSTLIQMNGGSINNINFNNNKPFVQLCATVPSQICNNDSVVTDVKINNMQDPNGNWLPLESRCCPAGTCNYIPVPVNNYDDPTRTNQDGEITTPSGLNCSKVGVCIQQQIFNQVDPNQIFTPSSLQLTTTTCPANFIQDQTNIHQCNDNNKLFLCKKVYNK
jgi:hypothetical protein